MKTNQADYPVRAMCRALGLSPSGYYAWLRRLPSARARRDAQLASKIRRIHDDNRQVYVSRRRRGPKTTKRSADARPWADLVERDYTVDGPDQLWIADITYIPTWAGFLYLAVVLDAWSRRIVGWAMACRRHPHTPSLETPTFAHLLT